MYLRMARSSLAARIRFPFRLRGRPPPPMASLTTILAAWPSSNRTWLPREAGTPGTRGTRSTSKAGRLLAWRVPGAGPLLMQQATSRMLAPQPSSRHHRLASTPCSTVRLSEVEGRHFELESDSGGQGVQSGGQGDANLQAGATCWPRPTGLRSDADQFAVGT